MSARLSPLLLAAALLAPVPLLVACRTDPKADSDLSARVLFTASGSYDAQADKRERLGRGLRQVSWTTRPPLEAGAVTVKFNGEARAQSWAMNIVRPTFTAQTLAGAQARRVQTPLGEGLRPAQTSRLKDTLILPTDGGLQVLTRGYVTQRQTELLGAFTSP